MTPEQFSFNLPPHTGSTLPISPPFVFNGLSTRVFPLRANLDTLQQLCNSYFNDIPPEVGRFRASLPYVYLAVLDYGQIAQARSSVGWFAQTEVYFCVPVEWFKWVDGQWVFHDWAVITPFIYVDDRLSVPLGRSVYGFPKALAQLQPVASSWAKDVWLPETLVRVDTDVLESVYTGAKLQARTFLEIKRQPPVLTSATELPIDLAGPMAPWTIASNFAESLNEFYRTTLWLAQSWRVFPDSPGPSTWMAMIGQLMPALNITGEGMGLNSLNLKQFRDSADPEAVCYQGLTNGRMRSTAVTGGGLLGAERNWLGDLTGGFSIELAEYASLPITRTLGLQTTRRWRGDGVDMVELLPMMPFWVKVDVAYLRGENLAWRSHDGVWKDGAGAPIPTKIYPTGHAPKPWFNTTANPVMDDVAGPFRFANSAMRILPMPASTQTLQNWLDAYVNQLLNDPEGQAITADAYRLTVWGDTVDSTVYLVVTAVGEVISASNNVGEWVKDDLSFLVPVQWQRRVQGGEWETLGYGVLPAFNFVDHSAAAITRREVQGLPTLNAQFLSPSTPWMQSHTIDAAATHPVLEVRTDVIPALYVGQKAVTRTIIEILSRRPEMADGTTATDKNEYANLSTSVLDIVQQGHPLIHYTLKQFSDVAFPQRACYQSVQRFERRLEALQKPTPIHEVLKVRFHDYATLGIARELGIRGKTVSADSAGVVLEVQVVAPLLVNCNIDEGRGVALMTRAGDRQWVVSADASTLNPLEGVSSGAETSGAMP